MKKLCFAAFLLASTLAHARDNGQWEEIDPKVRAWYQELKQPDHPHMSCCGLADAYYADKVVTRDGKNYAIITDTRVSIAFRIDHRAIPNHELRFDPVFGTLLLSFRVLAIERMKGAFGNFLPRQPDRGERGMEKRTEINVVESSDGNIFGHTQACILDGTDCSDCGYIVEAKKRSKVPCAGEHFLHGQVAQILW
jgi:hypothetical protein